jgi:uncharacterized oxidoreductase
MQRSGNTVLITGGASGIGLELARIFVDSGNRVVVCGRDETKLAAARSAVPGLATIRADVGSAADREALAHRLAEDFPDLSVLINNAGTVHVSDLLAPEHVGELENEIATNFFGPVALTSALLPLLRERPASTIVNVTTGYVFLPSARTAPYSATKTALHVMTKSLRYQLRGSSTRVVEVMPPPVATAMADHYAGAKRTPHSVAREIFDGLLGRRDEIVIGLSRVAALLGRIAPRLAFQLVNDDEVKKAS